MIYIQNWFHIVRQQLNGLDCVYSQFWNISNLFYILGRVKSTGLAVLENEILIQSAAQAVQVSSYLLSGPFTGWYISGAEILQDILVPQVRHRLSGSPQVHHLLLILLLHIWNLSLQTAVAAATVTTSNWTCWLPSSIITALGRRKFSVANDREKSTKWR